jgi:hypothetical protein
MKYLFEVAIIVFCLIIVICPLALPKEISGKDMAGGYPSCESLRNARCGNRPSRECVDYAQRCSGTGENECKSATHPASCCVDASCVCLVNQNCNLPD